MEPAAKLRIEHGVDQAVPRDPALTLEPVRDDQHAIMRLTPRLRTRMPGVLGTVIHHLEAGGGKGGGEKGLKAGATRRHGVDVARLIFL